MNVVKNRVKKNSVSHVATRHKDEEARLKYVRKCKVLNN
jgi:hypothetical protein